MCTIRGCRWALLAALLLAGAASTSAGQDKKDPAVTVKVVKYAGMGDTIKQLKGKVVVVDVWGLT